MHVIHVCGSQESLCFFTHPPTLLYSFYTILFRKIRLCKMCLYAHLICSAGWQGVEINFENFAHLKLNFNSPLDFYLLAILFICHKLYGRIKLYDDIHKMKKKSSVISLHAIFSLSFILQRA